MNTQLRRTRLPGQRRRNEDMDRDMTTDAETDKSAEAPGNDPAKKDGQNKEAPGDNRSH